MNLVNAFITIVIALFPVYFWAYALKLLGENSPDVRLKFWTGVFSGLVSVGAVFVFFKYFSQTEIISYTIFFALFLGFFYAIIALLTNFGSQYSAKFLRRVSLLHLLGMLCMFLFLIVISKILTGSVVLGGILATIFIPAFFEEISKHFSVLGLLGKSFSFSLRDLTLFTFCVVLGFVFVENILYFFAHGATVGLSIFRSIFVFSVHLLSSLICTLVWWKSLGEKFGSIRYFSWFLLGILGATLIHTLYNYSISAGNNILFLPYAAAAYGLFVYLIKK